MINNNMLNGIALMLGGGAYTIPSYLAFGSSDMILSADNTITSGEFDRNLLESVTVTDNVVKYVGTRSSVEANDETFVNVSLVNSSTLTGTGDIQSNFLIASLTHTTDFDITTEFWFTIQSGV